MESLAPMHDPRYDKLANVLVEYSTRLKRNETVLIEAFDVPDLGNGIVVVSTYDGQWHPTRGEK